MVGWKDMHMRRMRLFAEIGEVIAPGYFFVADKWLENLSCFAAGVCEGELVEECEVRGDLFDELGWELVLKVAAHDGFGHDGFGEGINVGFRSLDDSDVVGCLGTCNTRTIWSVIVMT